MPYRDHDTVTNFWWIELGGEQNSIHDTEELRDENAWSGCIDDWLEYRFDKPEKVSELRFVFDNDLNRNIRNMPCNYPLNDSSFHVPESLIRTFRVEAEQENGERLTVLEVKNNYQRLLRIPVEIEAQALRFIPLSTWESEKVVI